LTEKHTLRAFENRLLKRIFGPKNEEVNEGWKKLQSEELDNLYSGQNIVRVIKSRIMTWEVNGKRINAYKILIGKSKGKRRRGRSRCR
jgi:hypothetical protein